MQYLVSEPEQGSTFRRFALFSTGVTTIIAVMLMVFLEGGIFSALKLIYIFPAAAVDAGMIILIAVLSKSLRVTWPNLLYFSISRCFLAAFFLIYYLQDKRYNTAANMDVALILLPILFLSIAIINASFGERWFRSFLQQ